MPKPNNNLRPACTSADDLGLDAALLGQVSAPAKASACAGCDGVPASRAGERCWNCGRVLPFMQAQPTAGAYLISDAGLSDLIRAAGLLLSACEEPQACEARELVRGVVKAARKVGGA